MFEFFHSRTSWITVHHPQPQARLRLFCLPFAGGGASAYRPWAKDLPPDIEVVSIQPPGRENRIAEEPLQCMQELVESVAEAILPLVIDCPFALFGHSLGAAVALELTRSLARSHAPTPCHLIVSARPAPHLVPRRGPTFNLPREEMVRWLCRLDGTPQALLGNNEMIELVLPALRADLRIDDIYRSPVDPIIECPLTVLGGLDDEEATPDELLEWSHFTSGPFSLRFVKGNHFFPFNQTRSQALAVIANALSDTATGDATRGSDL